MSHYDELACERRSLPSSTPFQRARLPASTCPVAVLCCRRHAKRQPPRRRRFRPRHLAGNPGDPNKHMAARHRSARSHRRRAQAVREPADREAAQRAYSRLSATAPIAAIPSPPPKQFRRPARSTRQTDRTRTRGAGSDSTRFISCFSSPMPSSTPHSDLFDDTAVVQTTRIESYLFFAAELRAATTPARQLSDIRPRRSTSRSPCRRSSYSGTATRISLGIIHRRLHKRDSGQGCPGKGHAHQGHRLR